jgi:hypothetical protein
MHRERGNQQQYTIGSHGNIVQARVHRQARQSVSKNSYRGGIRPFLRFINQIYREFGELDTMTLERMDALEARCIKLCDEFHSWHDAKYG